MAGAGDRLNPEGSDSETIRRGEELYRVLARQLPNVAVVVFDRDLRVLVAEGEALLSYGVHDLDAQGRLLAEVMAPGTFAQMEDLCRAALSGERREQESESPEGSRCFRVFGKPMVEEDGEVWAGLVMAQDITNLRSKEKQLRVTTERLSDLAERDALTKLPNRVLLQDRLDHALTRVKRSKEALALLFIDVDRFKDVNDLLGHKAGDDVLRSVAQLLASVVRDGDTVARLGGDEFVILLDGVHGSSEALKAVKRITTAMKAPIAVGGSEVSLDVSIGIALAPKDAASGEELLAAADRAMYQAKTGGGHRHRFFDPVMHERALERLHIEAAMRRAIGRDEFVLHYQPAVDLQTGAITSIEALIRWNHPERGFLPPDEFIPIAEQNGFAVDITTWVLGQACKQARAWERAGLPPVRVAINSCSRELSGGLGALVSDTLVESGLGAQSLEIEITERFLGEQDDVRDDMLAALKRLGVFIALDDFGTGYSSLARLESFPVDVLKIDRTFIAGLDVGGAIVRTIIALGANLGVRVIAEGVERESQLTWLTNAGCDAASGFLICPPLPAEEITTWLRGRAAS